LAAQTAEEFLQMIRSHCSFSDLLLGPDATIGKDKHGNRNHLKEIASLWGFSLTYLDALTVDGIKISSSKIRETIQKGDLTETEQLLGRKFSIYTKVKTGLGLGKRIGFPTLNMDVEILCLPPFGVYAVKVLHENKSLKGVANLGIAPTVRQDGKPILEVHLLDAIGDIKDGCLMEVILEQYIRPEIRFGNIDQLKLQIAKDIQSALRIL
jgi:riboflavin kinase/FMN adenylyltransferase